MLSSNTWKRLLYSAYSPIYDPIVKLLSPKRPHAINLLNIQPGDKVLIPGAGTGLDLPFLPTHAHYTAIDLTPAMLQQLKNRANKLELPIEVSVMDGHHLLFPNSNFDKVILHFILAVIPDPYRCLQEVERVLKPGGMAVIYDKFLPDLQKAAWWRKGLNYLTAPLATDINRQAGKIIAATTLEKVHEEPANFSGLFRILLVQKRPGKQ